MRAGCLVAHAAVALRLRLRLDPRSNRPTLPVGGVCWDRRSERPGRVALHGTLLFEHDPGARVVWEATTRKVYLDELPRLTRAHREFAEAVLRRGG